MFNRACEMLNQNFHLHGRACVIRTGMLIGEEQRSLLFRVEFDSIMNWQSALQSFKQTEGRPWGMGHCTSDVSRQYAIKKSI